MNKLLLASFAFVASIGAATAADLDDDYDDYSPPPPSYAYPPPPAYARRPPGVVFYAPNPTPPSRCLPGFFWRVYPMEMALVGRGPINESHERLKIRYAADVHA